MEHMQRSITLVFAPFAALSLHAQCPVGEVAVEIQVLTNNDGYETYWQLVPHGQPCGAAMIAEGGNLYLDCDSGGTQSQVMGGYGNNTTYVEGPWCLTEGAQFDVWAIDDWGDQQASISAYVDGVPVYVSGFEWEPTVIHTFGAQVSQRDMAVDAVTTAFFCREGDPVIVAGTLKSYGQQTVNSFDLVYTIDGGAPVLQSITGVSLNVGDEFEFEHAVPWIATSTGTHDLSVWAQNINGAADDFTGNDQGGSTITVSPAVPQILDLYLTGTPVIDIIADSDEDLLVPRDLDFHPDPARNELWVVNKDTEASGSSTVKFTDAGEATQTFLYQEDVNNWHFMNTSTGFAFGDNGNFATCPGIFDANQNGGDPFTGPSLWNSDPAVYAQPIFGGLGSHIDMLHVTPNSQGIAHDRWNRYWVVDGYNGDVVMHDFKDDHGPGNSWHLDAVIRRYDNDQITRDPNNHIVSHCALDKASGWLYVVDHGGQRVFRINTNSGSVGGAGDYGPWENYVEYSMVTGYDQDVLVTTGLVQPAGIDVRGDRMIVSDHSNGDIVIYDVSTVPAVELGRVHTLQPGIMGVVIGPDGRIWWVNATTHELGRATPGTSVGVVNAVPITFSIGPNPAADRLWFTGALDVRPGSIVDAQGRLVQEFDPRTAGSSGLDIGALKPGAYSIRIGVHVRPLLIAR